MTLAPRKLKDELHRILHPDDDERRRREDSVVTALSEIAGTTVPWLLGAVVFWMMGTLMTGWNVGFF